MKHILTIDVESNGLRGLPFAVGAVVMDVETEQVIDTFWARCPIDLNAGVVDPFVVTHVLPALQDKPTTHENLDDMMDGFVNWYMLKHGYNDVFVDCGFPVETRFLQLARISVYPVHEVATLLLAAGENPDIEREAYVGLDALHKHDPVWDAEVSARCAIKAWKKLHVGGDQMRLELFGRDVIVGKVEYTPIKDSMYGFFKVERPGHKPELIHPNAVFRMTPDDVSLYLDEIPF